MPYPFADLPDPDASSDTDKARSAHKPVPPALRHEKGDVNAYRGTEPHGVPYAAGYENPNPLVDSDEYDPADWALTTRPKPEAIEVVVVAPARTYRSFDARLYTLATANQAERIVGRRPERLSLTLTNKDTINNVYIASAPQVAAFNYYLAPGETLTLEHTNVEVWAFTAVAGSVVGIIEEFETVEVV